MRHDWYPSFALALILAVACCKDGGSNPASDVCAPNPCSQAHRTVCVPAGESYRCDCDAGYELEADGCVMDPEGPCRSAPCTDAHRTVCVEEEDGYRCDCDAGYDLEGDSCVLALDDPCASDPCTEAHRSVCVTEGDGYSCQCDDGYVLEDDVCGPSSGTDPPVSRRLRMVVDPRMMEGRSIDEVGQDMVGYVADLNAIYATTRRIFVFDPAHDIESYVMEDSDFSGTCTPFEPGFSYAAYLTWQRAFGGACDIHGTNESWVISAVNPRIMSREDIGASPENSRDYMAQVVTLAHELGHGHGLEDYYRLRNVVDDTGIEPDLSIGTLGGHSVTSSEAFAHFYWSRRTRVLADPMFDHADEPAFCPLSEAIINFNESDDFLIQCPYGAPQCLWDEVYDDMQVNIEVMSEDGRRLVDCSVRTYIQPAALSGVARPAILAVEGRTDGRGNFRVDLGGHLTHARESLVALFKVACDGYVLGGDAVSIYDFQARHMVPDGGDPDGFHVDDPLRMTLATAP